MNGKLKMMKKYVDFDLKKNIFIFGTGANARKLYDKLLECQQTTKICAFVDNDLEKRKNKFYGKKVISAEELKEKAAPKDIIILSMNAYEEVERQLQQLGIDQTLVISIHEYFDMIAEEAIVKVKRNKENKNSIRIGFLTQEIQSWDKTAPVYEAMKESDRFLPFLFVVPQMDFRTCELTKSSQLEKFKLLYSDDEVVLAYGEEDLLDYRLDYLFLTAPYDSYYPESLRSSRLAGKILLCYIPYGYNGAYNFIANNTIREFFRNIYIIFTDTIEVREKLVKDFSGSVERNHKKILDIGYPSLENVSIYRKNQIADRTIMWTPRWSYDSVIGGSHFFEYYNFICDIKKIYPAITLMFRPHPMMFDDFLNKKLIDEKGIEWYRRDIASKGIILDEDTDTNILLENVSVLITDFSTLIMQFFMTGKPIIYCASEFIRLNHDYTKLMDGIYIARNEREIETALHQIIEEGDPLKVKRESIREEFSNKFRGTIDRILQTIEIDFTS